MSPNNPLAFIEKLTGRGHYSTWRFAVKTYLEHEELWDCIQNPSGDAANQKHDIKAKSKIILLVASVNYVYIQEARTAKEVWDNLTSAFDDSGLTGRVGLLRECLCTTTLAECQNKGAGVYIPGIAVTDRSYECSGIARTFMFVFLLRLALCAYMAISVAFETIWTFLNTF